ncbi:MAG: hypothetical protein QNJ54_35170 [Prochloraceae cyanobacterium]|nr:hypothetical protein [Prochloraceae cyanobacterium]
METITKLNTNEINTNELSDRFTEDNYFYQGTPYRQVKCEETKLDTKKGYLDKNELFVTSEKLQIIASLDPYLARNEDLLIGHYKLVKTAWGKPKLNELKLLHSLNLRQKFDRCLLAVKAAEIQLQHYPTPTPELAPPKSCSLRNRQLEPQCSTNILTSEEVTVAQTQELNAKIEELEAQLEKQKNQYDRQVKLNLIIAADRLLPSGPPLSGVQKCPAMQILGEPTTKTELDSNYRQLKENLETKITQYKLDIHKLDIHPDSLDESNSDNKQFDRYIAQIQDTRNKLDLVKSLYKLHSDNWEILKPTIPIADSDYQRRMNQKIPHGWSVQSFWS